ncbi:hypothetical protein ACFL6C_05825 [Myxococcota bacterium]
MRASTLLPTLVLVCACGETVSDDGFIPTPGQQMGLVLTTTYETSSVDAFTTDDPCHLRHNLVLASGDATIRSIGDRGLVINRGDSNLQVIGANLTPGIQVALPGCEPHDATLIADDTVLVTCYQGTTLMLVDIHDGTVTAAADLSSFADADGKPEMDQLAIDGDRVYVTLQRLDPFFTPTGNGLVAVLDLPALTLLDVDTTTPGVQAFELPLTNPYTRLSKGPDGRLYVGCVGDWLAYAGMGVVALDPATGQAEIVADGSTLGGPTNEVVLDRSGAPIGLVSTPDGWNVQEMRVVKLADTTEVVHTIAGFNAAGLALDNRDRIYVGNRSLDNDAGLWSVNTATGQTTGPCATGLPPFAIVVF